MATGLSNSWAGAGVGVALASMLGGVYAYAAAKKGCTKKEEKKMMSELETALLNVLGPLVDALHEVEKDVEMWKTKCENAQISEEHMTKECEKRDARIKHLVDQSDSKCEQLLVAQSKIAHLEAVAKTEASKIEGLREIINARENEIRKLSRKRRG